MAKKLQRKPKEAPTKGASSSQDDLAILFPNRTLQLAGRAITVREYGHIEGLRVLAWAKPFIDAMYATIERGSPPPTYAEVSDVYARHADLVRDMVAKAAGVEPDWVESLNDVDGYLLTCTWWEVNQRFFTRRLLERAAVEKLQAKQRDGATSIPSSSGLAWDDPRRTSAS